MNSKFEEVNEWIFYRIGEKCIRFQRVQWTPSRIMKNSTLRLMIAKHHWQGLSTRVERLGMTARLVTRFWSAIVQTEGSGALAPCSQYRGPGFDSWSLMCWRGIMCLERFLYTAKVEDRNVFFEKPQLESLLKKKFWMMFLGKKENDAEETSEMQKKNDDQR